MSFMKGDLLTKTRKLVKGLAKAEPVWLKAMEKAPPVVFPRAENKLKPITLPEDVYIKKFFKKHPDSKHEDAIKIRGFDPPPARVFGHRVLELKEQGVGEEEAMLVADMEYRAERKAKKTAYTRLKQIAKLQGKKPPPNPYPSAIKEIQAEERKFVHARFHDPKILKILEKMKQERAAQMQDRMGGGGGSSPMGDRGRGPIGDRGGGFMSDRGSGPMGDRGGGFMSDRGGGFMSDRGSGPLGDRGRGPMGDRGGGFMSDRGGGFMSDRGSGPMGDRGRGPMGDRGSVGGW